MWKSRTVLKVQGGKLNITAYLSSNGNNPLEQGLSERLANKTEA